MNSDGTNSKMSKTPAPGGIFPRLCELCVQHFREFQRGDERKAFRVIAFSLRPREKNTMDDGNNGPGRLQHLHHHGGGMEGAAGGGGGGGAVGGSSNGLTLSLPLPSASSSAKPSAPPGPSPQAAVTSEAAAAVGAFGERAVGGRDDIWSQGATVTLIEAWGSRYLELNRGNLKQKHWKEVADAVNSRPANNKPAKTDVQCKNRLDTLKKKYKVEKNRMFGGAPTKWALFAKMDELIGPSRKQQHKPQHTSPQLSLPLPHPPPPPQQQPPPQMPALPAVRQSRPPMDSSPDLLNNYNNHQSPDMTESCLNGFNNNLINGNIAKKRRAMAQHGDYSPLKELASAIMKFSEVYERIEDAKQQQMMYLEKQRMEFAKDLELQRMHLFMQNQLELAKIKHGKNGDSTEHYL